jgi:hypothetical protein
MTSEWKEKEVIKIETLLLTILKVVSDMSEQEIMSIQDKLNELVDSEYNKIKKEMGE